MWNLRLHHSVRLVTVLALTLSRVGETARSVATFEPCTAGLHFSARMAAEAARFSMAAANACNIRKVVTIIRQRNNNFAGVIQFFCVAYRLAFRHMKEEGCGRSNKSCPDRDFQRIIAPKVLFMLRYALVSYFFPNDPRQAQKYVKMLSECATRLQPRSLEMTVFVLNWFRKNILTLTK